ncbi:MAG: hypothetical protein HYZ42_04075 [Bacteroidetes bacterium]|nr:hypothetical protein [Bacteroidota bacterium]
MKNVLTIVLLSLFLITNSGLAVNAHWCGKKLASIHLASDSKHPCPCGKKAMKSKCCKDKTTTLKAKNDIAKARYFDLKSTTQNCTFTIINYGEGSVSVNYQLPVSNFYRPPPNKHSIPIYLLDRVFRI